MTKRYAFVLVFSLPLLWQSAMVLIPGVISIILQLLNLGGGGLTFTALLGIIGGILAGASLSLGVVTVTISAPVFVLAL